MLGDGGAGKTALTVRFAQGYFQESYKMTVGVDFSVKLIEVNGKRVKNQIWDTGGQERFSFVRPLYYRGAMGALLVFDVTNRESFDHLPNWIEELTANTDPVPFVLVGNKIDLPNRAVSPEEAWSFAKNFNIKYYYETSAKTGEEVGDCFYALAHEMMGVPLSVTEYPTVMQQLGLAGGTPAPAAAPASAGKLPVPTVQTIPQAPSGMDSFAAADEYGGFDDSPIPIPKALPVPKPVPVAAPAVQPLPRVQPVSTPKPVPSVQPLPKPAPKPEPAAIPRVQPLPKPTPIQIPTAGDIGAKPSSLGLFKASAALASDVPPVEMPEMPKSQPRPQPQPQVQPFPQSFSQPEPAAQPAPQRQAKPIPVTPKPVSQALPDIKDITGTLDRLVGIQPAPSAPASGPVIFDKKPSPAAEVAPARQAPGVSTSSSSAGLFASVLAAKKKAGGGAQPAKGGIIPFSSGFTAKPSAGGGGKDGAIGFFIMDSVPENLRNLKKEKKKKKDAGDAGAGAGIIKCPGCGYSISSKQKFCNRCGQKIS